MTLVNEGAYKAVTAEGRLFEAAMFLQLLEADPNFNPDKKNLVNVIVNSDTRVASITASLPVEFEPNPIGGMIVYATEFLSTPGGQPIPGAP